VALRKASARAADDSANAGRPGFPACFDIQERQTAPAYDYVVCRTCKRTWFLPKDPARRTANALDILAAHAASHSALDRSAEQGGPNNEH
jgi:hypothetical protein